MEENYDLVTAVCDHNSIEKNIVCCIEEMSELTKVLTKKLRKSPKFKEEDLIEELAHVLLMCNVLVDEFGIREIDIYGEQSNAVSRMYQDK